MHKQTTIATPRYYIKDLKGNHFDIFNKRANAISKAINLALEFSGVTFVVMKNTFHKEKQIFSVNIDVSSSFDDTQTVYSGFLKNFQKKLDKTKYWRKADKNV